MQIIKHTSEYEEDDNSFLDDLPIYDIKTKKINSERADLIRQFTEEINRERIGTKYKPITPRSVAILCGHIKKIQDLYYFLSQARDYKNRQKSFSKYFFGAIKVK